MKKGDDDEVDLNTSTVGDGDDDSSSSDDDDDVIDSEVTAGVGGGTNITDEYRALILEEEGKVEEIADALLKDTQEINKHFALYDELVCAGFNSPHYQDITPMFVDGTPFLIDGLSLVTCVLHDSNYNRHNGGQLLHFIYLCERIIELICRKGGTCEIIFFKDKADILQDVPELCLLMAVLKIHLSKNTDITVHEMDTIFCSEFVKYVTELHPSFIVIDFDFAATFVDSLPTPEIVSNVKNLLCYYGLFCLSFGLYCVDISSISFHQSVFYSFVSPLRLKKMNSAMGKDFSLFSAKCRNNITNGINSSLNGEIKKFCKNKVRKYISLQVAELISKDETSFVIENSEIVKLFLLYCSIVECFPLNCRSFNSVNESIELGVIIKRIIYHLNSCLQSDLINEFDCALIGDIWHGNLFFSILSSLKNPEVGCDIGERLNNLYSELIDEFNEITGNKLTKYPILSNNSKQQLNKIITVQPDTNFTSPSSIEDSSQKFSSEMCENSISSVSLQDQFNDTILGFCSDVIQGYNVSLPDYFKGKSFEDYGYKEKYHWHCLKSLTDDYDRVRDHQKEFTSMPMKKILRMKAQYARYMTVYGSNIEGKALDNEPIVVCEPQKEIGNKKKQKKQNKVSSSAKKAEIIEKNTIKKKKEVLDAEKQKFDRFLKIYKSNKTEFGDTKLKLVNEVLLQLNSDEYTGKLLYYKMEVLYQFWIDKSKRCSDPEKLDLTYLKELFLAIKQLLQSSKKVQSLLTDKQKQKVGKILCNIGFSDLTEKWNLPKDDSSLSATAGNGQSYIRFQLTHLGPELDRLVEGQPDDRISGFIPDPWQKKLFDIVDKQQSALIVAPTSSGKTYASYYCMKKVIKESNDGRVIYVAPTKALVNQVAATIYARFKNKNMPQGMSVYGVFTRDYKHYASECQILITVPECLELLLMSPRRYSWLKTLKYVIFDEVHCLGSQIGGVTWERCLMLIQCPFLALSATIQNPREFWNWMQSVETYKKSLDPEIGTQVHLVVHSDRHNDLVKYIYGQDNDLHHIHPYALLTPHLFKVHCGIPGHLSMAPHEALELYDVMIKVNPSDEELLALDPDRYFAGSETGYIYRQEVKTYESKLKCIMEKWFTEKRKLCNLVVETLYKPLKNHEGGTKPLTFFQNNIASFVKNLQARNMLPALIFSYDRRYCEIIGEDLATYFKEKEIEYLSLKRPKSNVKVQEYDSDDDGKGQGDEGNEFTKHKSVKQVFRSGGRMERFKKDRGDFFPLGLSKCSIEYSLRGKGVLDTKDLQFIERRLFLDGFKKNSPQVVELQRGVGVHHAGIVKKMRDAVEMLFRTKFLNVVFATGTLALGIHMPCKTVVILGDSPFLNTLEYHQMSGRSGRRGYDKTGDVVFYGIDSDKMRILMTSKLPRISGNFPLTISFVLRLFLLLNDITDKNEKTEKSYKVTLNRTLTVLNQGMLYMTEKNLKDQMTHFVLFSCMLLKKQRLIDASCRPTIMSGFATHLHYHEPGNLAFIYLLRTGVFSELCRSADGSISSETCEIIVNILCRLFTNMPLKNTLMNKKLLNSVVKLPPLPEHITAAFNKYNDDVKTVFRHYFEGFSKFITKTVGDDNKLPLSGKIFEGQCDATELLTDGKPTLENTIAGLSKQNFICSAFAGLSGQTDTNLYSQDSLISNIRHQVFTDCKIIPLVNVELELNGYAYDFYRHGVLRSIVLDNGLKTGRDYALLYDFMLVLKSIETSLSELGMTDHEIVLESETDEKNLNLCVFNTFSHIRKTYEELFKKAYNLDHV